MEDTAQKRKNTHYKTGYGLVKQLYPTATLVLCTGVNLHQQKEHRKKLNIFRFYYIFMSEIKEIDFFC